MDLDYRICDPSGNITILVTSEVEEEKRIEVADELLKLEPTAQQVGYVSKGDESCDIELNMAGGEFCGNATLSTAALYKESHADKDTVRVKVSGAKDVISVSIRADDGIYTAAADMPLPDTYCEKTMSFKGKEYKTFLVKFDTMTHLVMIDKLDEDDIEPAIKEWYKELPCSALGIMTYDEDASVLTPAVLSNGGEFFCYESSCASGTTALGIYLLERDQKPLEKDISEPGGVLKIKAAPKSKVNLTGAVRLIK